MMAYCLFVERLTNVDFTYFDSHRGLVGETLWVDVKLEGPLNHDEMIWDFAQVKHQLKSAIEDAIDHKLLLASRDQGVEVIHEANETIECQLRDIQKRFFRYIAPSVAVCLVDDVSITPFNLQQYLTHYLQQLPHLVTVLAALQYEIFLYPDPCVIGNNAEPYFQYSHGLRQHQGPCQRIVHGHRSELNILLNQSRVTHLEQHWVRRWRDIYFGCDRDFRRAFVDSGVEYIEFAYHSAEGFYQIQLPAEVVYRLPESSTIECIAAHLANTIHRDFPGQHLQVKVYEGVNKGAMYRCGPASTPGR